MASQPPNAGPVARSLLEVRSKRNTPVETSAERRALEALISEHWLDVTTFARPEIPAGCRVFALGESHTSARHKDLELQVIGAVARMASAEGRRLHFLHESAHGVDIQNRQAANEILSHIYGKRSESLANVSIRVRGLEPRAWSEASHQAVLTAMTKQAAVAGLLSELASIDISLSASEEAVRGIEARLSQLVGDHRGSADALLHGIRLARFLEELSPEQRETLDASLLPSTEDLRRILSLLGGNTDASIIYPVLSKLARLVRTLPPADAALAGNWREATRLAAQLERYAMPNSFLPWDLVPSNDVRESDMSRTITSAFEDDKAGVVIAVMGAAHVGAPALIELRAALGAVCLVPKPSEEYQLHAGEHSNYTPMIAMWEGLNQFDHRLAEAIGPKQALKLLSSEMNFGALAVAHFGSPSGADAHERTLDAVRAARLVDRIRSVLEHIGSKRSRRNFRKGRDFPVQPKDVLRDVQRCAQRLAARTSSHPLAELSAAAADSSDRVRAVAALLCGRALNEAGVLELLGRLECDPSSLVRAMVAAASDADAADTITRLAGDPDPLVRTAVATAAPRFGSRAVSVLGRSPETPIPAFSVKP